MEKKQGHDNKYGMVIDLDKCTGCGTCMVACATENNVTVRADESDKERSITWMQLYKIDNGRPFPDTEVCYFPRPCMHCDEDGRGGHYSPCVSVCVATATELDPHTGIVSQIYTRCIGCRYCQAACPYHARYFNWWDGYSTFKPFSKGMERALSPEVSPRMRGVIEKCTFCHHRLMRARTKAYAENRRELGEEEYITACTEACPAKAIVFGDLNNPDHKISQMINNSNTFRLLERLKTEPKVYYFSSREWVRKLADNYLPGQFKPVSGKDI
ncbi:MAG: 4Fe-4S dicluster domain-containing protein [Deltaproteobacteria bacterium]|nr:4Fe-4S dicluster domain-containing protein [Deltaproteobacteria bacterium]